MARYPTELSRNQIVNHCPMPAKYRVLIQFLAKSMVTHSSNKPIKSLFTFMVAPIKSLFNAPSIQSNHYSIFTSIHQIMFTY